MDTVGPPLDTDLTADQGTRIIASNVVLILLPTLFVIARLTSRYIAQAGFWVSPNIQHSRMNHHR